MPTLTSRERVRRVVRREPTDGVAAMPYMYDIAAVTAGVPLRQFYTDPQAMVNCQLTIVNDLRPIRQSVRVGSGHALLSR